MFHDPGTEKAAATQSDSGLMYPPGWNLWTRYTRVIVFTNSCQALILRLPAVLHTPRFPCHRHADACIDAGRHAGRQHAHQLTGIHDHLTLADVGQMLVQHPLDALQNAGLPVNDGLLAGNAVLQGCAGGEGAKTVIHAGLVKGALVVADGGVVLLIESAEQGKANAHCAHGEAKDRGKHGVREDHAAHLREDAAQTGGNASEASHAGSQTRNAAADLRRHAAHGCADAAKHMQ